MEEREKQAGRNHARGLAVIASLLWSSSGFFGRAAPLRGMPGAQMAVWRAVFASLVLWPMVRRPQWSWKLIPMTLAFSLMNITYLSAFTTGSVANAIWLQNTAPVFVMLVGVFFLGERSDHRDWWLTAFVAAGVGLILWNESRGQSLQAVLLGLASGFFYAAVILHLRTLRDFDSAWLIALNHTVAVLVIGVYAYFTGQLSWPTGNQWLLLAGFGALQMGLPYVLFARALKNLPGHEGAGIGMIEPLLMPVWAYLTAEEIPAWWTIVGAFLIMAGLLVKFRKS